MFLLLAVARAEWFDYNLEQFEEYKKNSKKKPIFIIGWSPYCGYCGQVPNQTIIFKKLIENRTDFYATSIDCSQGNNCNEVYVPWTPYKAMVWGDNQDLWPITRKKNATHWLEFIDEVLADHAVEMKDDEAIEGLKNSSIAEGGSTFVLTVGSENSRYLKEYRALANEYFVYKTTFGYQVVPGAETKLAVWTCFDCKREFDKLDGMENLIMEFKWSDFHLYSFDEWKILKEHNPAVMLIVDYSPVNSKGEITEIEKYALMKMADKYCGKARFGYMTTDYGKEPLVTLNLKFSNVPLVIYNYGDCFVEYRGRTIDIQHNDFINLSINGNICGKLYDNMKGERKIVSNESNPPKKIKIIWWRRAVPGWKLSLYYTAILFGLVAIVPIISKIDFEKIFSLEIINMI